jgi:hypothetical protein
MNPSRRQDLNRLAQDLAVHRSNSTMDSISVEDLDYIIEYLRGIRQSRFGNRTQSGLPPARPNAATGRTYNLPPRGPRTEDVVKPINRDIRIPQPTRTSKRNTVDHSPYTQISGEITRRQTAAMDRLEQDAKIVNDRVEAGFFDHTPGYYNPYQVEGQAQVLERRPLDMYAGARAMDIDAESRLRHSQISRVPGQRRIHQVERFEDLPFNSHDERYSWEDPMPRSTLSRDPRRSRLA